MELSDTEKKVLDAMKASGKPLKTKEIAELARVDNKETEKVIKKLKNKNLIDSPKRCYYKPLEK